MGPDASFVITAAPAPVHAPTGIRPTPACAEVNDTSENVMCPSKASSTRFTHPNGNSVPDPVTTLRTCNTNIPANPSTEPPEPIAAWLIAPYCTNRTSACTDPYPGASTVTVVGMNHNAALDDANASRTCPAADTPDPGGEAGTNCDPGPTGNDAPPTVTEPPTAYPTGAGVTSTDVVADPTP